MKIISPLGIASDEIPTGNLLWVDGINGNDSLAIRGRLKFPFQTLTAAKNAALAGDTIMVLPGTYVVGVGGLAANWVNWHFLNGAVVSGSLSITTLFPVTSAMTFAVTGEGQFISGTDHVLEVAHASASVVFKGRSLLGTKSAVRVTNASSVIVEADSVGGDEAAAVDVTGGGTVAVRARLIEGSAQDGVDVSGGNLEIDAFRIRSAANKAVRFTGGTALIRAAEIVADLNCAVEYNNYYSAALSIRGARIVSKLANTLTARAVYIASSSNRLRLGNCVLVVNRTGPILPNSIDAVASQSVYLNGHCLGNNGSGVVTLVPASAWDSSTFIT